MFLRDLIFRSFMKAAPSQKALFTRTMASIIDLLSWAATDIEKKEILDYAIEVIGKELSYSIAARMLYWGDTPENINFTIPAPTEAYIGRKNLSLSGANVISDTYDDKKLRNAIKDVFTNGFHQINHYTGTYYPAINLVVVENGRHHLSAAMVKNSGSASLQICDLKKAYEVLKTDGAFWYLDGLRISSVPDARLAILYELARTKDALMLVDVDYALAQYPVPQNINPLNAYREEHFRSNLLELELQIKKYQISQLRKEVPNEDTGDVQSLEDKMAALRKEFNDWIDFEGQQLLRFYEENPPSNHFPPSQY